MRVGFIGLGIMGGGIARRIVHVGVTPVVWDRQPAAVEAFGSTVVPATSAAEVGAASDIVGVCVVDDAGVEEVVTGEHGLLAGMQPGGVIVIHSTVQPSTPRTLHARAAARGVSLIDAPVSGGPMGAEAGRLLVIVGSDDATLERCRPYLTMFGNPVIHVGSVGTGQVAKLVNNVLMTANLALADDALELGQALGIERAKLLEVLEHGTGDSFSLHLEERVDSIANMHAAVGLLLRKDVDLVEDVAHDTGVRTGSLVSVAERALAMLGRPGRSDHVADA